MLRVCQLLILRAQRIKALGFGQDLLTGLDDMTFCRAFGGAGQHQQGQLGELT